MNTNPCEMFRALSVETRLRIFEILKEKGPLGVKRLAELVEVTPAAVSQHLKVLKHAGLVRNERRGYWIPYSVDERMLEHCRGIMNRICSCGWHGNHRSARRPHGGDDDELRSLQKYKKRIEKELASVTKRIEQIKSRGE
ncbi:MAG: winged helix-turn-helix transcriptional regulator [bacterium]|nr:MAG: winged helix-turn-helix transcriptional regulator [bacterium]